VTDPLRPFDEGALKQLISTRHRRRSGPGRGGQPLRHHPVRGASDSGTVFKLAP
jgi:hypothetical protein